jgi:protein-S-isoprenylcysteine O-methyltransferase Ste14
MSTQEVEVERATGRKHVGFGYGALPLMVLLPPLVYYMWICITRYGGSMQFPSSREELSQLVSYVSPPTWQAAAIYLGWFGFQALLQIAVPGKWADGTRLKYKMNGWFAWWFTWACLAAGVLTGVISPTLLYDQFGPLLTVTNLFAFALAGYLYVVGKRRPDAGRVTGNVVYDYFMGSSLNPRNGLFDWKLFCEARPGLIGWIVINVSILFKQYQVHGSVSNEMILVNAFQFLYIADYYFHEEAILTTWDIKHENFGWMLVWGDCVWVPYTYTLQAFYLLDNSPHLPWWGLSGITILNLCGYYIFRAVNLQKHKFRRNPEGKIWGKPAEFIKTQRGTLLLTSGWWGVARHLNYCGDLMMALAWCMTCGFHNLLPYFYIIYFTILLVHRERRDHAMCAQRYGKDWDVYCEKVPYRIFPKIY